MIAVICAGLACLIVALVRLPAERADVYFVLLSVCTIGIGSRLTIQIPRFKSHFAVSDTFIFLTLLIYGGEFAIVLSAIEAIFSSWRFCNKKVTVFFNSAAMAVSTSTVFLVLNVTGLYSENVLHGLADKRAHFIIALSVIALTQFIVNTSLAAIYTAVKNSLPVWETWKTKYIWVFFSYFVGAISAGGLVQLADTIGIGMIFATFPVVYFVFLSYRMYMKAVELSMQQAEQAEQYAKAMEVQSEALRESEERFRSAFNYAPIGIALVSADGFWLKVNRALCELLGYSEEELLERDFQSMIVQEDLGETLVRMRQLVNGVVPNCQLEHRYLHKSGHTVWASWSASAANDSQADDQRLIFQIQDISGKKSAEAKLQHDATHDALTALPNRPYFMSRLTAALEKSRDSADYNVSILFIDLDRFKYVNDSLGHLAGDLLLKGISERLRECMRPDDLVARLGGDEFTILVEGNYDENEVTHIADRIQQKFSIPFELNGSEVYSSASIGILHASTTHLTSEDMMRDADTAMYHAKRAGKARHEVFDENMFKEARDTLLIETELRRAVEREELTVCYQPIYSLLSGRIEGFEALARWNHKDLGEMSPAKFIAVAEEIGVIDKLAEHVLRTACLDIGTLSDILPIDSSPKLSVNLSCKQFAQSSMVRRIEQILAETRFAPELLRFEITESVFVEHPARGIEMLRQLREFGIDIHIDDFGTGYSNMSYLVKLPISTLKIDRSFVDLIGDNGENTEIVRAIITLAHTLDLKVIAEGIETDTQLKVLENLGCEGGQGYLFAEPMKLPELRRFIENASEHVLPHHGFDEVASVSVLQ